MIALSSSHSESRSMRRRDGLTQVTRNGTYQWQAQLTFKVCGSVES
jgi:hypothetical protein